VVEGVMTDTLIEWQTITNCS